MTRSCAVALSAATVDPKELVWLPPEPPAESALMGAMGGGAATVTEAVVELFAPFDSLDDVVTTDRLVNTVPGRTSEATFTTMTKLAVAPPPKEEIVLVMTPPEPTGGLTELHPGAPELETKVVLSGSRS